MKKREFNALLRKITTGKRIDINKIEFLSEDERDGLVYFIVSNRGPVIVELITNRIDQSWLARMGYMYYEKRNGYTFLRNGG
jgi:hypothetical protein